jgi:hypothetical protein
MTKPGVEVIDLGDYLVVAAHLLLDWDESIAALGFGRQHEEITTGIVITIIELAPSCVFDPHPSIRLLLVAPESLDAATAGNRHTIVPYVEVGAGTFSKELQLASSRIG